MKKREKKNTNNTWIFDAHQDIAISGLYTNRSNFFVRHDLDQGESILGIQTGNQSDYPRLVAGNVRAVFGSSCAFSSENGELLPSRDHYKDTREQIMYYHLLEKQSPDKIFFICYQEDVSKIKKDKLGILLHVEGADFLFEKKKLLKELFTLGVRSLSLTWNFDNNLAGGALSKGDLSEKGRGVVDYLEELNILVDLAHLNISSTHQALAYVKKPCIISHTNCKALYNHPRNVDDVVLRGISNNGGVVCISGVSSFVDKMPSFDALVSHILHAINVCGEDHVAFGSDFSVMTKDQLIPNFSESSDFLYLIERLREKGLSSEVVEKLSHKNILRVLKNALPFGGEN